MSKKAIRFGGMNALSSSGKYKHKPKPKPKISKPEKEVKPRSGEEGEG